MKRIISIILVLVLISSFSVSGAEVKRFAVGDVITFGSYPQTKEETDYIPIEWIVLDYNDVEHKALLLSRYGLDVAPYHRKNESITWEKCTLRAWLNDDFFNKAFKPVEQTAILTTVVDNSNNQCYENWGSDGGNNTQDRVFLLSYAEANRYLDVSTSVSGNTKSRVAPIAYAIEKGAITSDSKKTADGESAAWWWLRSPGYGQHSAACVSDVGSLSYYDSRFVYGVVRPALWLDMESEIFRSNFVFRNGVTWEMNKNEILDLEKGEYVETETPEYLILYYSNVAISKFNGYLKYIFLGDALQIIAYGVDSVEQDDFNYLLKVYDSKYGEHQGADLQTMIHLITRINSEGVIHNEVNAANNSVVKWITEGGTEIWMFWGDLIDKNLVIYYVPQDFIKRLVEDLNTTGI